MNDTKIVRFDLWCLKCKFFEKNGDEEPCTNCLDVPMNIDSTKPVYYEKKEEI